MRDDKYVILYMDDDQDCLDSVRVILESNGYIMEEAPTAEDGLKKFKQVRPDLILVDLMMEEVDSGAHFVKELKLVDGNLPVYILSSVGDQLNLAYNYEDMGLDGVFQKPIQPRVLIETLKDKLKKG